MTHGWEHIWLLEVAEENPFCGKESDLLPQTKVYIQE